MKFYGNTDDANSASSGPTTVSIGPSYQFGGGAKAPSAPDNTASGKGSIDAGDLLGSIGKTAGQFKDFATGFVGGIGIPGGPNLGDVAELPGGAVDAIGGITLPYLGNDPNKQAAKLGDVPGLIGDVLSAPEQFVETGAAKGRLTGDSGGTDLLANLGRGVFGSKTDALERKADEYRKAGQALPADLVAALNERQVANQAGLTPEFQARLDAGENVDALASEMAKRGIGFNNDAGSNLVASFVLDPVNLLSFGAGKAGTIARNADRALQAGEEIGVGTRFMGTAYHAASRGLSASGAALMDNVLGPTTSGVFHALGTRPYASIVSSVGKIGSDYGAAFSDAFARGAAQMPRAVIARYMAEEATAAIKNYGQAALRRLPGDISGTVEARLGAIRTVNNNQIERRTEELLNRTAPDFAGHTDEGRFIESRDKLAQITGMSPEDAARALGGKADLRTAQTIHLAFYGKAGDDLARARATVMSSKVIDPARITLISDDTLTAERAADILSGKADLISGVDQFSILRNRFGNTSFDHEAVKSFIQKLSDEGALPQAVKAAVTGKKPLPPALADWRAAYGGFGYDIGFAPKDGWKTVIDDAGEVTYADPFVHFVSEADPVTMRNPLGRFMDSLFRGSTQTSIIADSRARMVQVTRKGGLSANEARSVHQRILQTAADEAVSPRGLSLKGGTVYQDIFRDVLGESKYAEFVQKVDPDFAVMKAFEGNLSRIGLTQKFTGKVKTATAGRGNVTAAVAEGIYPNLRFRFSPLFQAQEVVESPFFNLMRGVKSRIVSEDVQKVYSELSDLPDFKYLAEAGYTLNIAGAQEVGRTITAQNTLMGKALARVPNVKAFKERQRVAQVFHEHGPAFEEAVNSINPKLWAAMRDAYGTSDPRAIADAFIRERMALASGNMDEAMAVFDAAKPSLIQGAYDAGRIAEGQAANVAAGVARGANGAGGAMKLTAEELAKLGAKPLTSSHDMETVWQAFRESFRQSSEQAFKTHYFNPTRGFLERSINHPYLGLYPASYMWGKVLPEFARFLVKRPFGLNAPLLGLAAYDRVQQAVIGQLALDPKLNDWVDKSNKNGVLYLVDQMLPAMPSNIPSNFPAWARHLSQDAASGKKIDPQAFASREAKDTIANATGIVKTANTALGTLGDLGDIGGDIFARLTNAAHQLDAQFQPPTSAPRGFGDFSSGQQGSFPQIENNLPPGSGNVFNPNVQLDPSQVIDRRGEGKRGYTESKKLAGVTGKGQYPEGYRPEYPPVVGSH